MSHRSGIITVCGIALVIFVLGVQSNVGRALVGLPTKAKSTTKHVVTPTPTLVTSGALLAGTPLPSVTPTATPARVTHKKKRKVAHKRRVHHRAKRRQYVAPAPVPAPTAAPVATAQPVQPARIIPPPARHVTAPSCGGLDLC